MATENQGDNNSTYIWLNIKNTLAPTDKRLSLPRPEKG